MFMTTTYIVIATVIGVIGCLTCLLQICHKPQVVHDINQIDSRVDSRISPDPENV
jgi:hypothetical protein